MQQIVYCFFNGLFKDAPISEMIGRLVQKFHVYSSVYKIVI